MAYVKIRPRRSTAAEWEYDNPVLAEAEMAIEVPVTGVGTGFVNVKFGDGVTHWKDLPYGLVGNPKSGYDENYLVLENRLNSIESYINQINSKLVVSSPNISIINLDGTVMTGEMTIASDSDIKILDARTKSLEDEIESLQTILLLLDDVS